MGLEGIELLMEVEERFNTSISDSTAEQIETIGDLHSFLMKRIEQRFSDTCPSTRWFYIIRKMLVNEFGIERSLVRPSAFLQSLVCADNRHKFWRQIKSTIAPKIPNLKRSKWLQWYGDVFPENCSTVGQLIQHCVNVNRITGEFGSDDSNAVYKILCDLVSNVADVDSSLLKPETSFVNDLGF